MSSPTPDPDSTHDDPLELALREVAPPDADQDLPVADPPSAPPDPARSRSPLRWFLAITALAIAGGAAVNLHMRLAALERTHLDRTVVASGLGLQRASDEVIAAALESLTDVAVESGAWYGQLAARDVDPKAFLDRLVALDGEHDRLLDLAGSTAGVRRILGREPDLLALADTRHQLSDLASEVGTLAAMADAWPRLAAVASSADSLEPLAAHARALSTIAAAEDALLALAGRSSDLGSLADASAELVAFAHHDLVATQQLAVHAADLVDLAQRRKPQLDRLADSETLLLTLAAQQDALSRLAHRHQDLLRLASSTRLTTLEAHAEQLEALSRRADDLLQSLDSPGGHNQPASSDTN